MNVGDLVEFEDWASDDAKVVAQVYATFTDDKNRVIVGFFHGGFEAKPKNLLRKLPIEEAMLWKLENL
jgi:hypothetical protein